MRPRGGGGGRVAVGYLLDTCCVRLTRLRFRLLQAPVDWPPLLCRVAFQVRAAVAVVCEWHTDVVSEGEYGACDSQQHGGVVPSVRQVHRLHVVPCRRRHCVRFWGSGRQRLQNHCAVCWRVGTRGRQCGTSAGGVCTSAVLPHSVEVRCAVLCPLQQWRPCCVK